MHRSDERIKRDALAFGLKWGAIYLMCVLGGSVLFLLIAGIITGGPPS